MQNVTKMSVFNQHLLYHISRFLSVCDFGFKCVMFEKSHDLHVIL